MLVIVIQPIDKKLFQTSAQLEPLAQMVGAEMHKRNMYRDFVSTFSVKINEAEVSFLVIFEGMSPKDQGETTFIVRELSSLIYDCGFAELIMVSNAAVTRTPGDKIFDSKLYEKEFTANQKIMDAYKIKDDDIPEEYKCAVSSQIMDEPVYFSNNSNGRFDREKILFWLYRQDRMQNPLTRVPISVRHIEVDRELKDKIDAFKVQAITRKMREWVKTKIQICVSFHPRSKKLQEADAVSRVLNAHLVKFVGGQPLKAKVTFGKDPESVVAIECTYYFIIGNFSAEELKAYLIKHLQPLLNSEDFIKEFKVTRYEQSETSILTRAQEEYLSQIITPYVEKNLSRCQDLEHAVLLCRASLVDFSLTRNDLLAYLEKERINHDVCKFIQAISEIIQGFYNVEEELLSRGGLPSSACLEVFVRRQCLISLSRKFNTLDDVNKIFIYTGMILEGKPFIPFARITADALQNTLQAKVFFTRGIGQVIVDAICEMGILGDAEKPNIQRIQALAQRFNNSPFIARYVFDLMEKQKDPNAATQDEVIAQKALGALPKQSDATMPIEWRRKTSKHGYQSLSVMFKHTSAQVADEFRAILAKNALHIKASEKTNGEIKIKVILRK